jgi:MFS family permease
MGGRYAAVTASVLSLVTIIAFETMAVSTAMPRVTQDLGAGTAYGLAFSLMFTGQLLGIALAGALAALRGPVATLWAGATLFALGSLTAGLATGFSVLLAGRLVAGVGAGLCLVAIYVMIGAAYPRRLRPTVFAWVASAWVLPSIVGPLVAAAITQVWGWRAVFLIIVPLTGVASVGISRAGRLLAAGEGPEYRPDVAEGGASAAPTLPLRTATGYGVVMTIGATLFQAGVALPGLRSGVVAAAALLGLALLAWSVPPLLPPGTLRMRRGQPSVMLARFLLMAAFNATVAFVPLMLVEQDRLDLVATGVLLTLASLGWALGSFVQSRPALADRGAELIQRGTLLLVLATTAFLAGDVLNVPTWGLGLVLTALGCAMGIAVTSTSVLALELARRGGHAAASASLQVADVLGSVIGIAAATGAYTLGTSGGVGAATTFALVWALAVTLAALCLPAAYRIREGRSWPPAASAAAAGTAPPDPASARTPPAPPR